MKIEKLKAPLFRGPERAGATNDWCITKFDLAVKYLNVTPGSPFEQTMMGWSPQCYTQSFMEIGPPVPDGFLPYRGVAAILVMLTASCHQIFISLYLKAFIQSLVQIGTVVSEKIQFEFLYVHDLGPRSRNDTDLQYSHIFIYSIRCLLLLTFRSLAAIVSEKSNFVYTFLIEKPKLRNVTLP